MADRIDAPGHVVHEENPRQAAPDEPQQRSHPRHGDQTAEDGWEREAQRHPEREQSAHASQHAIRAKIGHICIESRRVRQKQPSDMSMPEPLDDAPESLAMKMRRM